MIGELLSVAKKRYEKMKVQITYIGSEQFDTEIVVRERVCDDEVFLVVNRLKMKVENEE